MAACCLWMAASVGVVAFATNGPILRPDVRMSPVDVAVALSVGLAIGWPLLTANRTTSGLTAGQGTVALALSIAASEFAARESAIAVALWIAATATGSLVNLGTTRLRGGRRSVWAVLLASTMGGAITYLGKR